MAKKRTRSASAGRATIVRAAAPIVRVSMPSSGRKKTARRRRSSVGGSSGGIMSRSNMNMALSGAVVGFATKQGWIDKLPAIPVIGRIGAAALITDYWGRHGGGEMARNAATGLAFLAGYQLGNEGTIHGDEENYAPTFMDTSDDSYE